MFINYFLLCFNKTKSNVRKWLIHYLQTSLSTKGVCVHIKCYWLYHSYCCNNDCKISCPSRVSKCWIVFFWVCPSSARITDAKSKRMWTVPPPLPFSFAGLKFRWSFTCVHFFYNTYLPSSHTCDQTGCFSSASLCRHNSLQSHCDYRGRVLWSHVPSVGVSTLPQSPWATQHWFQPFSKYCANAESMKTTHCASLLLSSLTPNTST